MFLTCLADLSTVFSVKTLGDSFVPKTIDFSRFIVYIRVPNSLFRYEQTKLQE